MTLGAVGAHLYLEPLHKRCVCGGSGEGILWCMKVEVNKPWQENLVLLCSKRW